MAEHTPLYERHKALGAEMRELGEWEVPWTYSGIVAEHKAVRERAGLFDLSHMGKIEVAGPAAVALMGRLVVGDLTRLPVGRSRYTLMCREDGGIVDDPIAYRLSADRFLLIVNGSSPRRDLIWIIEAAGERLRPTDVSASTGILALQGPRARDILQRATTHRLDSMDHFAFADVALWGDVRARVARTGYAAEDGFELSLPPDDAGRALERLLDGGQPDGLLPCGFAAWDVLRIEAGLPLYGRELAEDTNPLEAGLAWAVDLDTPRAFIGREAIALVKESGVTRKLVGLKMRGPTVPRPGAVVTSGGEEVGHVTSAAQSLSLGIPIAMAYVATPRAVAGTTVEVRSEGHTPPDEAEVCGLRFVHGSGHGASAHPGREAPELSANEWLRRSEADLHAANSLLRSGDLEWSIVLCGQAVAKTLKAAYAAALELPPPTYDLIELFRGLDLAIPDEWAEWVSVMQQYHRDAFHPDPSSRPVPAEPHAQRVHLAATELCDWVKHARALAE